MSGTMPVRQRNAAWEALKKAAQRIVDAEECFDISADDEEIEEAEEALAKAQKQLEEVWARFPECWGDHPSTIPPAISILDSIKRQEDAEEWAEKLKAWNAKKRT